MHINVHSPAYILKLRQIARKTGGFASHAVPRITAAEVQNCLTGRA